jgi:hypothetical protein
MKLIWALLIIISSPGAAHVSRVAEYSGPIDCVTMARKLNQDKNLSKYPSAYKPYAVCIEALPRRGS